MEHSRRSARLAIVAGLLLATPACPARAQDEPVGPCSPYRAADGDIPSEMPGCARRRRPAPGSLADEMEFRRARRGDGGPAAEAVPDDEAEVPARRRARRPRRD